MEKTILNKTHQRLLGSLLFVLEQKTEHIEHIIKNSRENASYIVEHDLDETTLTQALDNCTKLKEKIAQVSDKYSIRKRKINLYHYVNTIQSQMWEHISDAFSDKLKGYGEKIRKEAQQVDPDISELSRLIDNLKL